MRFRYARVPSLVLSIVVAGGFASCSRPTAPSPVAGGGSVSMTPPPEPTPTPTPAPTPMPAATARYQVTFDALWSASTHPVDFPGRPHFSPLIGGTHDAGVAFWVPGGLASEGIERMAERGFTSPLDAEIQAAVAGGRAQFLLTGGDIFLSPASTSLEFDITTTHPLVTLVTMVAPSPDWFVGVSGLSLMQNGDWTDEMVVSLRPWDAGTDSGTSFESPDADTQPRMPIAELTGYPVESGGTVSPMGKFTFKRIA